MNAKSKKVLIISYVWPPYAAVGVYRILKFVKYLRDFNIEPVILTPKKPTTMAKDEGLRDLVPEGIKVYHSWSLEPFAWRGKPGEKAIPKGKPAKAAQESKPASPGVLARIKKTIRQNLSIPDNIYFWSWTGLGTGISAIKDENIDMILSSSPPHTVQLLGYRLARATGKPHLVDFRDLWSINTREGKVKLPPRLQRRNENYERKVLKNAAAIMVNTGTFKEQLLRDNDYLEDSDVDVITNGVDPDDFSDLPRSDKPNDKFTMVYTGSIYRQRGPDFFFKALRDWMNRCPEVEKQTEVVFIGNWSPEHDGMLEEHNIAGVVDCRGWQPQREALRATFAADLLLLFQGFHSEFAAAIPRKLGEYMITNIPILAFTPKGEIPKLIEKYDSGVCFTEPNHEAIIEFLQQSFEKWKRRRESGEPAATGLRSLPDLETYGQVRRLAEICNRI